MSVSGLSGKLVVSSAMLVSVEGEPGVVLGVQTDVSVTVIVTVTVAAAVCLFSKLVACTGELASSLTRRVDSRLGLKELSEICAVAQRSIERKANIVFIFASIAFRMGRSNFNFIIVN